jgi:hypothetical protein
MACEEDLQMACEGKRYRQRRRVRVFPHYNRRVGGGGGGNQVVYFLFYLFYLLFFMLMSRSTWVLPKLTPYKATIMTKTHNLSSQQITHPKNFNTSLLSLSLSLSLHTNKMVIVSSLRISNLLFSQCQTS